MRRLALFAGLFFTALVAGGAFVIWIEFNPAGMSASLYTATMQHAIQVFTAPLPAVVLLSVAFTAVSTFMVRHEPSVFRLLLVATICAAAVAVITALGNIPINNQIKTWQASAPPPDWADLAAAWWRFQTLRAAAALVALSCLILAAPAASTASASTRTGGA